MTSPTARQPTPPAGPYDPMFGLQEKVASLLTPVFQDARTSELFAYQISCRSLQAYECETRADFVNAGRTIAFSLAAIALVKEVFNPALELEDKKRIAIHANALNRSADQAERSMMDRRRYRRAYPTFPVAQEDEPDDAEAPIAEAPIAESQVAEAVTAHTATQPTPPTPEINPAAPPIRRSASQAAAPIPTSTPSKRPNPSIPKPMFHAVNPTTPPPRPLPG